MNDIISQMMNPNGASPEEKPLKAPPREAGSKQEQEDIVKQMALGPTSSDEDNTVSEVKKSKEEMKKEKEAKKANAEDIVSLVLSGKSVGKKYREKLVDQATKDPNSVAMKVGDKWKTVRKAMQDGDLGNLPQGPDLEKLLGNLDPELKQRMMSMLNPRTTDASPEQLAELGMGAPGMGEQYLPQAAPQPQGAVPPQPGAPSPDGLPPEVLAAATQGGVS